MRTPAVLAGGLVLVALSGCAGGDESTSDSPSTTSMAATPTTSAATVATMAPATTTATSSPSTTAVDSTAPSTTVAVTTAPGDGARSGPLVSLRDELVAPADDLAFRGRSYQATTFVVPGAFEIREDLATVSPLVVAEVDASGRVAGVVDNGSAAELSLLMSGVDPASAGIDFDAYNLYYWRDGDSMVIDTTEFQQAVDQNPAVDLGAVRPGVFSVDIGSFDDLEPAVVNATVGANAPSLSETTESLLNIAPTVTLVDEAEHLHTATASLDELTALNGTSVEALGSLFEQLGLPVDAAFFDTLAATEGELLIDLDDNGVLERLGYTLDFTDALRQIAAEMGATDAEIEGIEYALDQRSEFELDPSIDVTMPPDPREDRTAEFRMLIEASGG